MDEGIEQEEEYTKPKVSAGLRIRKAQHSALSRTLIILMIEL